MDPTRKTHLNQPTQVLADFNGKTAAHPVKSHFGQAGKQARPLVPLLILLQEPDLRFGPSEVLKNVILMFLKEVCMLNKAELFCKNFLF